MTPGRACACTCGCDISEHCGDRECCEFTLYRFSDGEVAGGGYCSGCMNCSLFRPQEEAEVID